MASGLHLVGLFVWSTVHEESFGRTKIAFLIPDEPPRTCHLWCVGATWAASIEECKGILTKGQNKHTTGVVVGSVPRSPMHGMKIPNAFVDVCVESAARTSPLTVQGLSNLLNHPGKIREKLQMAWLLTQTGAFW